MFPLCRDSRQDSEAQNAPAFVAKIVTANLPVTLEKL